jgi:uncharacterized delta-60 repeat protein
MKKIKLSLFALGLSFGLYAQQGSLDLTFNPSGAGADGIVYDIAPQADGKIIIAGNFTNYNGSSINRVARLNANGTLDNTFNPGVSFNAAIRSVAIQSDGKILLGGEFTNRLVRLESNGSVDGTFSSYSPVNATIYKVLIQPSDGKILIGGAFTAGIARLNTNGSVDGTFNVGSGISGATATVYDMGFQTIATNAGKLIVAGDFTSFTANTKNRLIRLNANGTYDATFNASGTGADGIIYDLTIQADDKIVIGGTFLNYNVSNRLRVARISSEGDTDNSFNSASGSSGTVFKTAVQSDGKIYIGGSFGTYGGTASPRFARLTTGGALDNGTFPVGVGFNGLVYALALEASGNKILVGGSFTDYDDYEVTNAPSSIADRLVRILSANPPLEWTGATSNAWNTASNWSTNAVPSSTSSPIIPNVGANFYPTISTAVELSSINVQSGANLTIASGGSLSLPGVLTNNGTITIQNGGALLQTVGSTLAGTGTFSVRRNLPTANRFHYIGSPVNNVAVNAFGIAPTSANGAANGSQLVPQTSCNPNALELGSPWCNLIELVEDATPLSNCSQSLWHVKSAGNLTNGRGYAAMAYGASTTNLSFNGQINNGNILYDNLTSTSGTILDPLSGNINRGWHLVSNPYPSPISMGAGNSVLTNQGFASQVQVWNAAAGSWIPSTSNSLIPVGQGFQIRNFNTGAPLGLEFNNNLRTISTATFYELPWEQFLTVTMENNQHNMQTVIFFHEEATDGYDYTLEANRLFGDMEVPVIYTLAGSETEKMAFNGYAPLYNESKTVVMGVYDGSTPGSFTLRFQDMNTLPNISATLEDTKLNTFTPITEGFVYNFTTVAGDDRNRFRVHFSMLEDAFIGTQTQNLFSVFPNPTDDRMNISFSDASQVYTISLRDLSGKTLLSTLVNEGTQNMQVDAQGFASGVYLLEVRSASGERNVVKLIKK